VDGGKSVVVEGPKQGEGANCSSAGRGDGGGVNMMNRRRIRGRERRKSK
jgi:hypothetical protein